MAPGSPRKTGGFTENRGRRRYNRRWLTATSFRPTAQCLRQPCRRSLALDRLMMPLLRADK
jgi:hypothetical protein